MKQRRAGERFSVCARAVVVAGVAWLAIGSRADAQRYRVLVGEEATSRVSLVEFRPCVPAETSDCGAWLVRTFDAATDSANRPGRGAQRIVGRNGATIEIRGASVVIATASGRRPETVAGTHGRPLALTITPDEAYVFGIFVDGEPGASELEMIDMNTRTVWAVYPLRARPAGLAMAP